MAIDQNVVDYVCDHPGATINEIGIALNHQDAAQTLNAIIDANRARLIRMEKTDVWHMYPIEETV